MTQGYGLWGHIVPEVFDCGKWKMYDPELFIAYANDKNEILSISELTNSDLKTPYIFKIKNKVFIKNKYLTIIIIGI